MPTIIEFLRSKLTPWMQHLPEERFIVARPQMQQNEMPARVHLTKRAIKGKRVIVKRGRFYQNTRSCVALWPDAKLAEVNYPKIICVLSGNFEYQIGNYVIHCGEGYFVFVPPGIPTTNGAQMPYCAPDSFCEILTFILHRQAVQCVISRTSSDSNRDEYLENYLLRNERLVMLLHSTIEEQIESGKDANIISADILRSFLAILQRELSEGKFVTPGPMFSIGTEKTTNRDFKTELLHYIQTHLNKGLHLEKAAKDMYLSRTQFIRKVREETGKTFVQFVTDYRMEEAKVLLRDSDWTINSIAGFLGYKTPSYFRKIFMEHSGMKPSHYRISIRKKSD